MLSQLSTPLRLLSGLLFIGSAARTSGAQTSAPPVSLPACQGRAAATLSSAQQALVTRASNDPVLGCAALDATHRSGDFTVAAGDTVRGNLVVVDGTLQIAGTVTGTAIAINGAIIIDSSGHVLGDAVAAEHGATIAPTGRVDGELRTLDAIDDAGPAAPVSAMSSTLTSLKQTAAGFGLLLLLAVGVLTNAGDSMQRVTAALRAGFGRNVTVGILAQLALLPLLAVICLLLALTLLGILLIPFAIVAYVIAVLGLLVLGALGAVQLLGSGIAARRPGLTERTAHLQALVAGILLLSLPWLAAAGFASSPLVSAWIRTLAIGMTWIAVTAGLGAALRTRGGTRAHDDPWGIRRPAPSGAALVVDPPKPEWLTPTPLTGVVAVKRERTTTGGGSLR